jgi:hypothetical protein
MKSHTTQPTATYRLTGSVRVEGTGAPVAGGRFVVLLGDVTGSSNPDRSRTVTSGEDGQFLVDLPPGQARAWTFQAPVGYWAPGNKKTQETFVLSRSQPIYRKDYVVRPGTVWAFRLVGADGRPVRGGSVQASTPEELFMPEADEEGRVNLTLPTEGAKMMAGALTEKVLSRSLATIPIVIPLEWASGFRTETVRTIERVAGGHSLKDESRGRDDNSRNGVTADSYGVRGYPSLVIIDRRGNVAFHSGIGTKEGVAAMKALGKEMGLEKSTMTEADFHRLWEAFFGREIEKILNHP